MSAAKSVASELRRTAGSEEYDLSNFDGSQVNDLVNAAFGTPFKAPEYVRITFVVGGGKKCRQKYSPDLPKDLSQALSALGFQEDRGASACEQCQGTYKYQHDTDKDLKFMHVFPRVDIESPSGGGNGEGGGEAQEDLSPTEWVTICDLEEMKGVVLKSHKVVSFAQRKALLASLKDSAKKYETCEQKMIAMDPLTDEEQSLYDEANALPDKIAFMTKLLEEMVADGKLTAQEKSAMLEQLGSKVEMLNSEIAKALADGKEKKAAKLEEAKQDAAGKAATLAGKAPITHSLRHEKELRTLWKKLAALDKIENSRTPQPLEEIKKLRDKPDVEARIAELSDDGRGWFMAEGVYEAALEAAKAEATRPPASKKPSNPSAAGLMTLGRTGGGKGKAPGNGRKPANNPYEMLFE